MLDAPPAVDSDETEAPLTSDADVEAEETTEA
jgi:hypothetical protein